MAWTLPTLSPPCPRARLIAPPRAGRLALTALIVLSALPAHAQPRPQRLADMRYSGEPNSLGHLDWLLDRMEEARERGECIWRLKFSLAFVEIRANRLQRGEPDDPNLERSRRELLNKPCPPPGVRDPNSEGLGDIARRWSNSALTPGGALRDFAGPQTPSLIQEAIHIQLRAHEAARACRKEELEMYIALLEEMRRAALASLDFERRRAEFSLGNDARALREDVSAAESVVSHIELTLADVRRMLAECNPRTIGTQPSPAPGGAGATRDPEDQSSAGPWFGGDPTQAFAAALAGEHEFPRANYGFRRDGSGGAELPAGFSAERIPMVGGEAGISLSGLAYFRFAYLTGDASTSFSVPTLGGGGASGIVNTRPAPSTSTGVTGDFGLVGGTDTSVDIFSVEARHYFYGDSPLDTGGSADEASEGGLRIDPYLGLAGQYRDRNHDAQLEIAGTTGGGFNFNVLQLLDQQVEELEISALLGVVATVPFGPGARFTVGAEARVTYFDFDLSSLETRTQNIGPTSDQSFTNLIEDGESGIGYAGIVSGRLGIDLARRVELFLAGQASYQSDRAQVNNPFSGTFVQNGGTTFLGTDEAVDWTVSVGLRLRLGAGTSRLRF